MNRAGWKQRQWPRRGEMKAPADMGAVGAAVLRRCPVTCGNPTVMSGQSFERLCAAARLRAADDAGLLTGFCLVCGGKDKPAELTIIDLCSGENREGVMPSETRKGICGACGRNGSVVSHFDELVCPSCQVVRIGCKNRPEVVVEQLRKLAPGALTAAAPVQVADESSLLAKLREIMDAGDGDIVQAAQRMEDGWRDAETIRGLLDLDNGLPLAEYVSSLLDGHDALKERCAAIRFVLGADDDVDIVTAAERVMRLWRDDKAALQRLGAVLKAGEDEDLEDVADRRMKLIAKLDRLFAESDLKYSEIAAERDRLAEEVRGLRERLQAAAAGEPFAVLEEQTGGCACGRDGVLLDLLIEALGDQVISLGAGQIKALREVS